MNQLAIVVVQAVSAFFRVIGGRACRFHPSCSVYATEAFRAFSFWRACSVTIKRILRCQPFSKGGFDPIESRKAV